MPNAYAGLNTLKSGGVLDISGTTFDSRLLAVLEDVSRWIDLYCSRHFHVLVTTRTFDGNGGTELILPDLISVTTLKTDDNKDRTFETTWGSSDFLLYPQNAEPTKSWGRPYTRVVVDVESGSKSAIPTGMRMVQIDGKWGYREDLATSSSSVGGNSMNASATSFGVQDGTQFSPGQTILIDAEQMYITSITGDNLTVVRAINGTTAASHAASATIQVYQYPAGIVEACTIQVARLWKRKDSAFASGVAFSQSKSTDEFASLDPDVRLMLSPYRRLAVGQGV